MHLPNIGVVNVGSSGNVFNVIKSISHTGATCGLIKQEDDFSKYDKIIFPGVGSFPYVMDALRNNNFHQALIESMKCKPTLGICLGLQVLCKVGHEFQEVSGLNIIRGEVRKLNCSGVVPNMGFRTIEIVKDSPIFKGISENDEFYFMHSYEVINHTETIAISTYNNHSYVCAIQKDHVFGVQFHPEKSREPGLRIIQNFIDL